MAPKSGYDVMCKQRIVARNTGSAVGIPACSLLQISVDLIFCFKYDANMLNIKVYQCLYVCTKLNHNLYVVFTVFICHFAVGTCRKEIFERFQW